jgi:phosphatidylglycerophosphate synthase
MHRTPSTTVISSPILLELAGGLAAVTVLSLLLQAWLTVAPTVLAASMLVYLAMAALVYRFWTPRGEFGWANRITLARAVLVAALGGVLVAPEIVQRHGLVLAALALLVIVLDGLDGWVARTIDGESRFGARFDMEVDALLIMFLCVAAVLAERTGAWVLAIGGVRYAFMAAGWLWPWLQRELPPSRWRKYVCVVQGVVLAGALLPWAPDLVVNIALAISLVALLHSFGRDTLWLWRRRAV